MDITDMLSVLLAHIVPSTVYKDSTGISSCYKVTIPLDLGAGH